jgi:tetrapyrrole methylase family protein/MazG family protein
LIAPDFGAGPPGLLTSAAVDSTYEAGRQGSPPDAAPPAPADITVVGLGPGPGRLWTAAAREAVAGAREVWVRTFKHPAAVALLAVRPDARSFDEVYDSAADLPAVYDLIAAQLLAAAGSGPVCYAVPGSSSVGEATVTLLRSRAPSKGLTLAEVPAISFIEPTLRAVGWDAFDGLQVADAMEVAARHHPPFDPDRPALVAQAYSRMVAGDLKLVLLAQYPPEHGLVIVTAAGTEREATLPVALADLDRGDHFDDETTVAIPPLRCANGQDRRVPVGGSLQTLAEMMARLRGPGGCPWDIEQTHDSLVPFLLEEAHEVIAAIEAGEPGELRDELGDLLLQIAFHAQIASEGDAFSIHDVVCAVTDKIVSRHPHVFGDESASSAAEVEGRWEELKRRERAGRGRRHDPFEGIPATLPALAAARQVQERTERLGIAASTTAPAAESAADLSVPPAERDIADALWEIVTRAREANVDPEGALRRLIRAKVAGLRATETIIDPSTRLSE